MATLITLHARAYVNWGKWIADCPMDCGSALALEARQVAYACPECKGVALVSWPDNVDEITDVLAERPVPRTRNWYPSGHDLALRFGMPHGQSVSELREEARDHGVDHTKDVR